MQEEDLIEHTNGKCYVFTFFMQEEDIHEHINVKDSLCTLLINL